mmetsp:Transcript_35925/g.91829  ORF Transcript_35925/g.91829 Transcript_35925/m.91829 type:complete len:281 (-) Transcript_35925:277-1119(-)
MLGVHDLREERWASQKRGQAIQHAHLTAPPVCSDRQHLHRQPQREPHDQRSRHVPGGQAADHPHHVLSGDDRLPQRDLHRPHAAGHGGGALWRGRRHGHRRGGEPRGSHVGGRVGGEQRAAADFLRLLAAQVSHQLPRLAGKVRAPAGDNAAAGRPLPRQADLRRLGPRVRVQRAGAGLPGGLLPHGRPRERFAVLLPGALLRGHLPGAGAHEDSARAARGLGHPEGPVHGEAGGRRQRGSLWHDTLRPFRLQGAPPSAAANHCVDFQRRENHPVKWSLR